MFRSLRARLILIFLPIFILSILSIALLTYRESATAFDRLGVEKLRQGAEMAYIICEEQENLRRAGRITLAEAQENVRIALTGPLKNGKRALGEIRVHLGLDDYFFAIDDKGKITMHPYLALGTDLAQHSFIHQFIATKDGSVRYSWRNQQESAQRAKITYLRHFTAWGWIIGVGDYMENFTAPAVSQLRHTLWLVAVFSVVLILALLALGFAITKPLVKLRQRVEEFDAIDPAEIIDVDADGEVGALVAAHNRMVAGIRERNLIKDTFGRYVSRQVQEAILNKEIPLEGTHKKATIVFTDIREFTGLSESLGPEGTIQFLNAYFSRMVDVIIRHEGTIDKFIGDAIMAVFGAPISKNDDAVRAVRAAMDLISALENFNAERANHALPPIRMGIGVHTGEVIAGNIGTNERMEYTVVGDAVNLASRTEALTTYYRIPLIITDSTYREIRDSGIRTREIDSVQVKGRQRPVVLYEIYDHSAPERIAAKDRTTPLFMQALSRYKMREFEQAIQIFSQVLALDAADHVSRIYLARCKGYMLHPPGEDWDGVFTKRKRAQSAAVQSDA